MNWGLLWALACCGLFWVSLITGLWLGISGIGGS